MRGGGGGDNRLYFESVPKPKTRPGELNYNYTPIDQPIRPLPHFTYFFDFFSSKIRISASFLWKLDLLDQCFPNRISH